MIEQEIQPFTTETSYCAICLKTSNSAALVPKDAKDFFETMKMGQCSPWLCTWCAVRLGHFEELRRRARRSHQLLAGILLGSLKTEDTYFKEELYKIQKEKYIVKYFPGIAIENQVKPSRSAKVIHSRSTRSNRNFKNNFQTASVGGKHKSPEYTIPETMNARKENASQVTTNEQLALTTELREGNKREIISALFPEESVGEHYLVGLTKDLTTNITSMCSDIEGNVRLKCDPLQCNDDSLDSLIMNEGVPETPSHTESSDNGIRLRTLKNLVVLSTKERAATKKFKRKSMSVSEKIKKKLKSESSSTLERAEALRRDINEGKKEIVLDETDDMQYATADAVRAHVAPATLSAAQERAAHELRLAGARYRNMRHRCEPCASGWASRALYEKHMLKHSKSAGEWECTVCGTRHASRPALRAHAARHYRAFRCRACAASLPSLQHAANHYFTRHAGIRFRCARCDKSYRSLVYLKKHFATHNKDEMQQQSMCNICKKVYDTSTSDSKYRFNSHVRSHGEGRLTFECEVCERSVSASRRSNHMKTHAAAAPCGVCHKTFRCRETLRQHVERIHTRAKKYQCDACGKMFFGKSDVRTHIEWTHLRLGGVTCSLCGMTFRKEYILVQHTRKVHENNPKPKDKLCDICGRGFAQRSIMEQHRLIHTGAKPHKCEYCGQMFRQKTAMNTHIKLKHLKMKWSDMVAGRKQRKKVVEKEVI